MNLDDEGSQDTILSITRAFVEPVLSGARFFPLHFVQGFGSHAQSDKKRRAQDDGRRRTQRLQVDGIKQSRWIVIPFDGCGQSW